MSARILARVVSGPEATGCWRQEEISARAVRIGMVLCIDIMFMGDYIYIYSREGDFLQRKQNFKKV